MTIPRRPRRGRRELVQQPLKPRGVNEFVGFLALREQDEDALANHRDETLGIPSRHARLHDEVRRYIYNLSNFLRTTRFVRELLTTRHGSPLPL